MHRSVLGSAASESRRVGGYLQGANLFSQLLSPVDTFFRCNVSPKKLNSHHHWPKETISLRTRLWHGGFHFVEKYTKSTCARDRNKGCTL